jgi:transcriptional regulator with XRE-family HTH domain
MKQPHPDDVEIGARLRSLRVRRGLTLTQLGEAIDVTYQQIQKYETGANRISGSRMLQIAKTLDVSVSILFGEDGEGATSPSVPLDAEASKVARDYARITDPVVRRQIAQFVTALADSGRYGTEEQQ